MRDGPDMEVDFDHAMGGLEQVSLDLWRHQDSIPEWR